MKTPTTFNLLTAALAGSMLFAGSAVASESLTPAEDSTPDTIVLEGTLRDFKESHPDMQNPDKSFGVKTGLVEYYLDGPVGVGKPVLASGNSARGMITGEDSFNQWFRDVEGVNKTSSYSITLEPLSGSPGVFYFAREKQSSNADEKYFFPMDEVTDGEESWNDFRTESTGTHNFFFTYELRTLFTFTPRSKRDDPSQDLAFKFVGDDDVWVFINGQLAVDIGGVHGQATGEINLDDAAESLGLEPNGIYELVLFFAERHVTESNFRIETTLQLSTETEPLYD
ncbi:fibro-slime domain-containing protein [Algisphaera agarilytica]|uniref:Fibro-slime domain-containing protein n=1 Tax=Algisphaera agarilytica TaxID=1385975 RepID=A0A7X0H543_9BACT|nr:fibro-slime domain-containing protein [Algisphaera agarilytica]MBB6429283.1 fibro-slime domain-containing protein [Algisphaera agarilytica]